MYIHIYIHTNIYIYIHILKWRPRVSRICFIIFVPRYFDVMLTPCGTWKPLSSSCRPLLAIDPIYKWHEIPQNESRSTLHSGWLFAEKLSNSGFIQFSCSNCEIYSFHISSISRATGSLCQLPKLSWWTPHWNELNLFSQKKYVLQQVSPPLSYGFVISVDPKK